VFFGIFLHQPGGRPVRDRLGGRVPLGILARTEIGLRADLLHAKHLNAAGAGLIDHRQMRRQHLFADRIGPLIGLTLQVHLDETCPHRGHRSPPPCLKSRVAE